MTYEERRPPVGLTGGAAQQINTQQQPTDAGLAPLCPACAARARFEAALSGRSELQRRRFPPNGNREEWIKYGPSGAPGRSA